MNTPLDQINIRNCKTIELTDSKTGFYEDNDVIIIIVVAVVFDKLEILPLLGFRLGVTVYCVICK